MLIPQRAGQVLRLCSYRRGYGRCFCGYPTTEIAFFSNRLIDDLDLLDDREKRLEAWLKDSQLSFKCSKDLCQYIKALEQGLSCSGTGFSRGTNAIAKDFFMASSQPLRMPLARMKNNVMLLDSIKKVRLKVLLAPCLQTNAVNIAQMCTSFPSLVARQRLLSASRLVEGRFQPTEHQVKNLLDDLDINEDRIERLDTYLKEAATYFTSCDKVLEWMKDIYALDHGGAPLTWNLKVANTVSSCGGGSNPLVKNFFVKDATRLEITFPEVHSPRPAC